MGEVSEGIGESRKELERAIDKLERHPGREIRCGDVAELLKLAQRVGDEQTVYAIRALTAVVVDGILKLNEKHEGSLRILAEAVRAYVDQQVGTVKGEITEVRRATWN
jgi:hypothetical protein